MLRYCLFLRSAPHHLEAKIGLCTFRVLPMRHCGATGLRFIRISQPAINNKQRVCQDGGMKEGQRSHSPP
ncbi:hypothetical protein CHU32_10575 [Superficieibacter electus]|uniref:Uncharacterized protein n=1 Tax=Superficieibacter electus TaxID=2022662 RepID=A0A2P5GR63_9ENTR|nr:hypothetical protein CHU33_17940 [Superficieibacter electus]POP49026.1 hypothetical protein CHU32_10575 [Superficieibacter electus]